MFGQDRNGKASRQSAATMIGIVASLAAGPARAVDINNCPFTISTPGTYQLTADLTCSGGHGITITSSNVALKLNGHTMRAGINSQSAIFVKGTGRVDHVTISGPGLIKGGFNTGVWFNSDDYGQVTQVTVIGATAVGINALDSHFVAIQSNIVTGNAYGIFLSGNSGNVLSNMASANSLPGIVVQGSGDIVVGNTANGNLSGINVTGFLPEGVRVTGNVTNGNAKNGIELGSAGNATFSNKSSLGNGLYDLYDPSDTCSGDVWGNNVFMTANHACIH